MATRLELLTAMLARSLTSDATIGNAALNEAYKDIVTKCELQLIKGTLTLVAGTDSYNLLTGLTPTNSFCGIHGIYYSSPTDGFGYLEPVDMSVMIQLRSQYNTTGVPTSYALSGAGRNTLELFPAPSSSGASMLVWFNAFDPAVDTLSADGTTPALIPSQYHEVIELRAAQIVAARYESAGENRDLSSKIFAEYQERLGELRAFLRGHESRQPRRVRVGYPRLVRPRPSTPSQDVSGDRW